jgi:GNAT superfamily N-acetyltransferase
VPKDLADRLDTLARDEPPIGELEREPTHAQQYVALLGGRVESGPAFTFPEVIPPPRDVIAINHLTPLEKHFLGWTEQELPERAPIFAVIEDGHAVSICFCARLSAGVAEAGLETAKPYRGRGLALRVTAAWALSMRASGRLPLYSTSWTNAASLAVARKLGLNTCAIDWNVYGDEALRRIELNVTEGHELVTPRDPVEWRAYHDIRRDVLFEARGQIGVYDETHPDERAPGHHSKLLLYRGDPVGVVRIDIDATTAIFRRVAVRSDVQRLGHGRALLTLAQRFAQGSGCVSLVSYVAADAVEFYQRCGFTVGSDITGAAGHEPVYMAKRLGERDCEAE